MPAANRLVHVPDLIKAHQSADYETANLRGFDAARSKIVAKH